MMKSEMDCLMNPCNVSGCAFELKTGRPWTWGFSMFRDREAFKIQHLDGRWFFEINGIQYSAKKIAPSIEGIQMHTVSH